MTRTSTILIAAIASLTIPAAASAAPKPKSDSEASTAAHQTDNAKPRRYCIVDKSGMTGSHLPARECKSLDAWLAEGVDPRTMK